MTLRENCVFCKILKKEIPSYKIYEDDKVYAFFDIHPASLGHTLIITKKHYVDIYDIPEKELKDVISVAKKLARLFEEKIGIKAVNLISSNGKEAQQDVFHFHIHLIPRNKDDGIKLYWEPRDELKEKFEEFIKKINIYS